MTGSSVLDGAFSVAPFGLIKLDVRKTRTLATEKRISVDDERCYDLSSVCALTNSVAVLAANHAAQSMLSLEGRPFSERISHIIPEELQKPFAKGLVSLLHGKSFEFEGILKAADGVEFQAHISGWAEADGSSPDQAMLSVTKLQHRYGDDALKTGILSDLAHAARISMLGEMTASISHEVNQPLGSIVTSAEAGLRWLNHEQPNLDEVRTLLERIVNSGRRAGNIVSTLNGLARNTKPERNPVEVARLIDEAMLILRSGSESATDWLASGNQSGSANCPDRPHSNLASDRQFGDERRPSDGRWPSLEPDTCGQGAGNAWARYN